MAPGPLRKLAESAIISTRTGPVVAVEAAVGVFVGSDRVRVGLGELVVEGVRLGVVVAVGIGVSVETGTGTVEVRLGVGVRVGSGVHRVAVSVKSSNISARTVSAMPTTTAVS